MTTFIEGRHAAECVLSEEDRGYCREKITILSGEGKLSACQVLGRVAANKGAITVGAAVPAAGNAGNGALTAANPAYGAGVQEGNYIVAFVEPNANAGDFVVTRPDGTVDGYGRVGVAYVGQVKFTVADGAADFVAGDTIAVPVAIADPTGVGKYRSADPTNTDGSDNARAVLLYDVDATLADVDTVALVRGPASVNGNLLVYDAAVDDANKKAVKIAELVSAGIVVR